MKLGVVYSCFGVIFIISGIVLIVRVTRTSDLTTPVFLALISSATLCIGIAFALIKSGAGRIIKSLFEDKRDQHGR